ncbi:hypothetical protein Glove_478g76 [Diversispora epigaea]|uniref:Uncharacterized protein n=1 Tax=Diversispora epigaea TaxID=1348612 RepID=A0A397GLS9_9GLOM|nr:hypothetical protein Glove_478g76 [Diversispora epigaea]
MTEVIEVIEVISGHRPTLASSNTEDEMANAVIDYLEDNLLNHISLRIDPFYGDGTQDPLQWMIHFEKVICSNVWDKAKKIHKYATYLENDTEEWYCYRSAEYFEQFLKSVSQFVLYKQIIIRSICQ